MWTLGRAVETWARDTSTLADMPRNFTGVTIQTHPARRWPAPEPRGQRPSQDGRRQHTTYINDQYSAVAPQRTYIEKLTLHERLGMIVHALLTWCNNRTYRGCMKRMNPLGRGEGRGWRSGGAWKSWGGTYYYRVLMLFYPCPPRPPLVAHSLVYFIFFPVRLGRWP
jgi:hypothetical protein